MVFIYVGMIRPRRAIRTECSIETGSKHQTINLANGFLWNTVHLSLISKPASADLTYSMAYCYTWASWASWVTDLIEKKKKNMFYAVSFLFIPLLFK